MKLGPSYAVPADKATADATRCARGFPSFKDWAKNNKQGQKVNAKHKRWELVKSLQYEYDRFIKPNL